MNELRQNIDPQAVFPPLSVIQERAGVRVLSKNERLSSFENAPHPNPLPDYRARGQTGCLRGFTLLELVLALGMVAILALSLYASMKAAFSATASADAAIEPARTADLAMELVGADLQNAMPPNTTIDTNTTTTIVMGSSGSETGALAGPFEGTQGQGTGTSGADDLLFFTTSDAPQYADANGEIKEVELTLDTPKGSTQQCLVRKVTANILSTQQITPDEEILCRGVSGFTLQYFDGTQWNTTWDSTQEENQLPAAVQVTLTLDRKYNNGQTHAITYTRVFTLACSTIAQNPVSNP
jgi:prepilin-type N-terminal cleavage/methylation domain-containing protein